MLNEQVVAAADTDFGTLLAIHNAASHRRDPCTQWVGGAVGLVPSEDWRAAAASHRAVC
jgi:hypothetical protein